MLIIGVDTRKKRVDNGLVLRKYCPKCRDNRELREYRVRKYFSLFFLPVLPLDKGESVLVCSGCRSIYVMTDEDRITDSGPRDILPVIDIPCIFCQKVLPVTVTGKHTVVRCPHCDKSFGLG